MPSDRMKQWNRIAREIELLLHGSTLQGVRLQEFYDKVARDAREKVIVERVLLCEFIEEGKVFVIHNSVDNITTYYPDLNL